MKRILFLIAIILSSTALFAQYPVSDASCAYCGVKLSKNGKPIPNVKHKSTCRYYVKEEAEESSQSTQSKHLKDYKPKEEKKEEIEANKKKSASSSANSGKVNFIPVEQAKQQHLSSVNIKNEYDKKLTDNYGYTAYGKTYPNGQELWVMFDDKGSKIGEFAGAELLGDTGTLQYFKVKGFNGLYGLYYAKYQKLANQYTDIKPLYSTSRNGKKFIYFDISQTGSDGLQKHGFYDGYSIKLPCEYDRIELLDGYRIKVTKNGLSGVVNEYDCSTIVPVQYSYLIRYVSKSKEVYYIVGNGESNKLGAWDDHNVLNDKPTIPLEYTLEQVRNILDKR